MAFKAQPAEKCVGCGKTVYATEKAVVEEKTDKKIYHKQCIRCSTCNKVLTTGNYSSMDGQFWCKPHFKQLFATKGNYDEAFGKEKVTAKWDNNAAPSTTPTSFIPEQTEAKKEAKPTSETTVAKFRQFREQGDADKCVNCGKTVYLAEKLLVEDKNEKRMFHKRCFTCSVCNMTLDLRSYGSFGGKIYCKNHLKEQEAANRRTGSVITAPTSFIPANEEKKTEKGTTPDNIASKFKAAETEKCKACAKTVYATERVVLPETPKTQSIYHKTCLKCSSCGCKLDVSSYGSANGALFCHTHLKQVGKPEQAKDGYFVSPLANTNPDYVPGPRDADGSSSSNDRVDDRRQVDDREDSAQSESREETRQEEREPEREPEPEPEPERSTLEKKFSAATLDDKRDESPATSQSSYSDNADDDSKRREDERARKREERQRKLEQEEREAEEERERRKKERERRLAEASNEESGSSVSTESTGESDRDRRRREREEERKRDEEEQERQEEKRRREREDKRKAQEEEMKRELEEQEKKAEERKKKLAELRGEDN